MYHTKVYCVKANLFLSRLVASSSSLITWSDINPPFKPRQNPYTPGSLESFDKSWKASNLVNLSPPSSAVPIRRVFHISSPPSYWGWKRRVSERYIWCEGSNFIRKPLVFQRKTPLEHPSSFFYSKCTGIRDMGIFCQAGVFFPLFIYQVWFIYLFSISLPGAVFIKVENLRHPVVMWVREIRKLSGTDYRMWASVREEIWVQTMVPKSFSTELISFEIQSFFTVLILRTLPNYCEDNINIKLKL